MPSASDSAITARTIAPASGSSGISRRNERSILSICTGSSRSRESDDQPAPKSSIASCSPSARSSRSSGPIRSGSRSVADSVSSIVSSAGSTPATRSRSPSSAAKSGRSSSRGETLNDTRGSSPSSRQVTICAASASITHAPIGSSRPISSAAGMKRSGCTSPRSGSCQRSSASIECSRPLAVHTIGW